MPTSVGIVFNDLTDPAIQATGWRQSSGDRSRTISFRIFQDGLPLYQLAHLRIVPRTALHRGSINPTLKNTSPNRMRRRKPTSVHGGPAVRRGRHQGWSSPKHSPWRYWAIFREILRLLAPYMKNSGNTQTATLSTSRDVASLSTWLSLERGRQRPARVGAAVDCYRELASTLALKLYANCDRRH